MLFRLDYVPTGFAEAVQEVLNGLTPEEREQLLALNSSELPGLGLTLGVPDLGRLESSGENPPFGSED